ncbi:eukaryotic translation initiation factor 4B3 [Senna tora]|uniref:Eukaryotic translation initiation factor 4B3 n=1 Tax=Senna tora TaxID=362788 RepID=A0A835CFS1_9FABA|nr:eukaryotic translation initiation factor 4B3 [Senna tora]
MAASVSAWAKPGAWALDSEEHEAELLEQKDKNESAAASEKPDFPSLAAAVATKSKKKKGQTISLADFAAYGGPKPSHTSQSDSLTHEDLLVLPTGPRQRTAEELERDRGGRLGGGFRSYGGSYDRSNRNSGGDESSNSRWGSSRVSSDEPRRNGSFGRDSNREIAPSRADEIDNWAAAKKSPVGNGYERRERERGGFFDSQSKADESDSWVSNKSYAPSEGRRFGSNGGGFERERRVGFGSSGGADSDNWNRKKGEFNGGGGSDRTEPAGGRPRLNLQPRSLPLSNENPESSGNVAKPKGPNPFGEARPREEVLAEKGQDWKKIDEQLETKIKETSEKKDGFAKRSFGSGNGRANLPEERTERSWRKPESDDSRPQSAEKSEDGHVEEN